ncbi:hypothetical protein ACFSKM_19615 [Ancylobacter dichloromethanicus]
MLKTGRNVWRVADAGRARVLVDGADYFGALRAAMREARETIHIAGWDLDSRMRLVGESGTAEDGLPETLAAFLSALVARNPRLRIRLLLWDYSVMFALERELTPVFSFLWATPKQIELCLDDALPLGASHHQKIVVIDDLACLFRRARPHRPALGHVRPPARRPAPSRPAGQRLRPVPRRADGRRRRGRGCARRAVPRALGARRLRAAGAGAGHRQSLARRPAGGFQRHRGRHRPHPAGL